MRKTSGTITIMKRIINHVNRCIPLSKLVRTGAPVMLPAMLPK